MSEKISVRIITTQKGYDKIVGLLEFWGAKELIETTAFADINKKYGDIFYLGWNRIDGNKRKIVQSVLITLMSYLSIPYRVCIIGKDLENISITSHINKKNKLPNLFVNCKFDNKKTENQLEEYAKEMEARNNEIRC